MAHLAKHAAFIDELMKPENRSIEAAAKAAGVSRSSAYRMLGDVAFRAKLDAAEGEMLDSIARRTVTALGDCELVLLAFVRDARREDAIRLRAAQQLVDLAMRLWEARHLERRLQAIEDTLNAANYTTVDAT